MKPLDANAVVDCYENGSIHPQGWVPIETWDTGIFWAFVIIRSIHPQGWVPIETVPDNLKQILDIVS